jgi:soluble lytic murein transglycosylase
MTYKKIIKLLLFILILISVFNLYGLIKITFPLKYSDYIMRYSKEYNLNPYLVAAVIKTESNFKKDAKSIKGAQGLMQITASTAEWAAGEMKLEDFNNDMLYQPEYNIRMGCWYIDNLKKEFNGNMDLVLAAYNGGRGNVQKWLADSSYSIDGKTLSYIPFKETDKYVKRVKINYNIYKILYSKEYIE